MKPFFKTPIFPYELNRPLEPLEKQQQIFQNQPSPCSPWHQLSVIKMNSTFLECPDKHFARKGFVSGPGVVMIIMYLGMMFFPLIIVSIRWSGYSDENQVLAIILVLFGFFGGGIMLWIGSHFFRKEMFRYTHYPTRFNRKTRKVYRFRDDGTIMVEDWDKLFFHLAAIPELFKYSAQEVRVHRLSEDGETVLDTFALPYSDEAHAPHLLTQWEFVRQYMEEGPEKLVGQVDVVQDIADRRQGFWAGFSRYHASMVGQYMVPGLIIAPLTLFYAVGRWIAMRVCIIPVWPAEVEAECKIEPDDPYIRDRDNLADPATVEAPEYAIGRWRKRRRT